MLVEVKDVRQIPNEGFRRWFRDEYFDVIVWYTDEEQNVVDGFQLCYDKGRDEHAVTWNRDYGFRHHKIDDGEVPGEAKRTPVLIQDGVFPKDPVLTRFEEASSDIDEEIRNLVLEKMSEIPDHLL